MLISYFLQATCNLQPVERKLADNYKVVLLLQICQICLNYVMLINGHCYFFIKCIFTVILCFRYLLNQINLDIFSNLTDQAWRNSTCQYYPKIDRGKWWWSVSSKPLQTISGRVDCQWPEQGRHSLTHNTLVLGYLRTHVLKTTAFILWDCLIHSEYAY